MPADQDLPPFMWAHATNVMRYPYDLAKARALLAEAGWTPGPDGIAAEERQAPHACSSSTNSQQRDASPRGRAGAERCCTAPASTREIKSYIGALLFAPMGEGGILQNGKYDLAWNGWVAGIDPDNPRCSSVRRGRRTATTRVLLQSASSTRPKQVGSDALSTIPTRKAAYERIEAMLRATIPVIPVWWPRQIQPINPDFKNFTPNPVTEVLECVPMGNLDPELAARADPRDQVAARARSSSGRSRSGDYVLSGGIRSDYYIDKFRLFSDPAVVRRIARMFSPIVSGVGSRT